MADSCALCGEQRFLSVCSICLLETEKRLTNAAIDRDALERKIERLEKALRPLAELNDVCLNLHGDEYVAWGLNRNDITAGDIRRACSLLGLEEKPPR